MDRYTDNILLTSFTVLPKLIRKKFIGIQGNFYILRFGAQGHFNANFHGYWEVNFRASLARSTGRAGSVDSRGSFLRLNVFLKCFW
jgi:hypothetical protein